MALAIITKVVYIRTDKNNIYRLKGANMKGILLFIEEGPTVSSPKNIFTSNITNCEDEAEVERALADQLHKRNRIETAILVPENLDPRLVYSAQLASV